MSADQHDTSPEGRRSDRRSRLDALLEAEREDAYRAAFKSGLDAIDSLVRVAVGTGKFSARAQGNARMAIGLLVAAARGHAKFGGHISYACSEELAQMGVEAMSRLLRDFGVKEPGR